MADGFRHLETKNGTIGGSAIPIGTSPLDFSDANLAAADAIQITVRTADLAYAYGSAPTGGASHVITTAMVTMTIRGKDLLNSLQFIRDTGVSAVVTMSLFKRV